MNIDINELIKELTAKLGDKEMQIIMLEIQLKQLQKQNENQESSAE